MKKFYFLFLSVALTLASPGCKSLKPNGSHDNGKHKGWYKNPKNPHNPAHTGKKSTPGNSGNGKAKGKK